LRDVQPTRRQADYHPGIIKRLLGFFKTIYYRAKEEGSLNKEGDLK
jgi:hypothetical protein